MPRGLLRDLQFDFKGFEITPREKTLRRPFYCKWAPKLLGKAARPSP